jgi:hypothetical protein
MFRKSIAAATTALVAAALVFGAVAAPASAADGTDTAPADGTATTTTSTPSADPTPTETPTEAVATDPSTPSAPITASDVQPQTEILAPALQCLPASAVSYTYNRQTNSGTITVANDEPTTYSDTLCEGFWVTATGWRFLNTAPGQNAMWPQGLIGYSEANGGKEITTVGSYDFGYPVTCGQGDIYAHNAPIQTPPTFLTSPSKSGDDTYPEYFLGNMFRDQGPYPTSTWTGPDDHTGQYCDVLDNKVVAPKVTVLTECGVSGKISWTDEEGKLTYALTSGNGKNGVNQVTATTHGDWVFSDNTTTHVYTIDLGSAKTCDVTPGDPTVTPAVCTEGGQTNGTIFVDQQPGILNYTITYPDRHTETVTASSISVPSGVYTVNVTAASGYVISGPTSWPLQVTVSLTGDCGQLPTDAALPTSVTWTDAVCSTGLGSITVGPSADYLAFIDYTIDGVKVTKPTTSVKAGAHLVTAALNPTTAAGDTIDGATSWNVTVKAASATCGQLKTLALTGVTPAAPLLAAGILLPAGVIMLLGAALIRRRRES